MPTPLPLTTDALVCEGKPSPTGTPLSGASHIIPSAMLASLALIIEKHDTRRLVDVPIGRCRDSGRRLEVDLAARQLSGVVLAAEEHS